MSIATPIWIQRVSRLPEPNQRVLVYAPASWQDITVATYKPDDKGAKHMFVKPDHQGVDRYIKGVTHWMSLPEAPLSDQLQSS